MVWYSHLLKNFRQFVVIHTVKGFGIVNKAEVFFWNSLAFSMIQWMLAISCSSAFSKSRLNIWKFTVHVLLKPGLKNFEHYFTRSFLSIHFFNNSILFFFSLSKLFPACHLPGYKSCVCMCVFQDNEQRKTVKECVISSAKHLASVLHQASYLAL